MLLALAMSAFIAGAAADSNADNGNADHECDSDLCAEDVTDCKKLVAEYKEHACCGNPDKAVHFLTIGKEHTHTCGEVKAQFKQCFTIRDHPNYTPSTGFTLGASTSANKLSGTPESDVTMHKWTTAPHQINLEYQARYKLIGDAFEATGSDSQNWWNAHDESDPNRDHKEAGPNWKDGMSYTLTLRKDLASRGSVNLPIGTYGVSAPDTTKQVDWTITAWGHTVLAGTAEEVGDDLVLTIVGGYRPFPLSANANAQEIALRKRFMQSAAAPEVISYVFKNTKTATFSAGAVATPVLRDYTRCNTDSTKTNYKQ